jgi:hypothetical protein
MKQLTIQDGKATPVSDRPTIHTINLIDASGSMNSADRLGGQTRYQAAILGINQEIKELKTDTTAQYLMSIYEFDSVEIGKERVTEHCFETDVQKVEPINGRGASGNTPLYQTLGYVIETFLRKASRKDRVLIKVFTDGFHNCMWGKYGNRQTCKELIHDAEKNAGFVITFVGTQEDVEKAVDLGINLSNTMVYDGTATDLTRAMHTSTTSTMMYAANVSAGTDTTADFFSNTTVSKPNFKPKAKTTKKDDNK